MIKTINSNSELISIVCENSKTLLYGTGEIANKVINILREYGLSDANLISFIMSPDKEKPDNFRGYNVLYSNNKNINRDLPIIISVTTKKYITEIVKTLTNFNYNNIYIFNENFFKKNYASDYAYKVRTMLNFQVNLTEHCNLNCALCQHFSSIAKPEFLDLEEYERDLSCLSKLFCSAAQIIFLVGGEPLLHPNVNETMALTRKYFKHSDICMVTNGVLLPQMEESFWQSCHDYSVKVAPTPYPIKIDYDYVRKKAAEAKVDFDFYPSGGGGGNGSFSTFG